MPLVSDMKDFRLGHDMPWPSRRWVSDILYLSSVIALHSGATASDIGLHTLFRSFSKPYSQWKSCFSQLHSCTSHRHL